MLEFQNGIKANSQTLMNMSLVMIECAKLNECTDWPMPRFHSMCLMVAEDLMEKWE
jgi:hypothetical protein